jgi:glycosyltransferase
MLLSVITVVKNNPDVAKTLHSVMAQKGLDLESVVIDGASTDGTLAALKPFRRRIRLVSAPDRGIYDGMNKGLRLAKGRVVGFLNAGDVFVGDRNLAAVAKAFTSDPALGVCLADLEIVDARGRVKRWWPAQAYQQGAFSRGWTPSHPTFYALRQALLDLGGFDTRYGLAADYDLMLKALELAHMRSAVVPRTLVRMHSGGASQASWRAVFRHNLEAWMAARYAGVTRAPFMLFLARKWGRKLPQLLSARPGR